MKRTLPLLVLLLIGVIFKIHAQDPERFRLAIKETLRNNMSQYQKGDLIVFTGSSSIRLWPDLPSYFPGHNVVNHGFGGSHMSDLLYYSAPLITSVSPSIVLLYEGDNDIASGKTPSSIIQVADSLIGIVKSQNPHAKIIMLSAKPSPSRWHLKDQYIAYNELLLVFCQDQEIQYLDVWSCLLNEAGEPEPTYFREDDLHMTETGYQQWLKVILPAIEKEK